MSKIIFVIKTILMFFVLSIIASCTISIFLDDVTLGNVALIPIKGPIYAESGSNFGEQFTSSTDVVAYIEDAEEDDSIKAIVFEINSPGGGALASKEIGDAIKRANKTTYAVIREVGASGGYWIASSTDHIIASELSITGSIGVISSYIEFAGLLERYNMTYQRLVSGKYKDMGTPFKKLEDDERDKVQTLIDKIYDYFVSEVAENRNMPIEKVRELATGEVYLGIDAYELGLIDSLGDMETAKEMIMQDLNITEVKFEDYDSPLSFLDVLSGVFSENFYIMGKGIGTSLTENKAISRMEILT